jgi:hypothetical protein
LTRASFLTAQSLSSELNPIKRGLAVVEKLLCLTIPPPPAGFQPPDMVEPGLTTREFLAQHDQNQCARSCHAFFDPPGFAFEHYDGIGAYRTMDGDKPVDASADILMPDCEKEHINGAVELSRLMANTPDVGDCLARHWFRRTLRREEIADDESHLARVQAAFRDSRHNLRDLMVSLVTSSAFTQRAPSQGENLQ